MNADVYDAVKERAEGRCECGGLDCGGPLEADHFFGRRRAPENVANVWLLARNCHRQKTDSIPSGVVWAFRFAKHCIKYGYKPEALRALDNGEFKAVRESLGAQL